MFLQSLRISSLLFIVLTVVFGLAYPAVVTGIVQAAFPNQAGGSLMTNKDGKIVGSALIGQNFSDPKYFWGRPSATGPVPYNASSSSGSNLSPNNQSLYDSVQARMDALKKADPDNKDLIPAELVMASGSGLDPHISPSAAQYQVSRVAKARNLGYDKVKTLVDEYTEGRALGVLGEPVVNVLKLNIALDDLNARQGKQ